MSERIPAGLLQQLLRQLGVAADVAALEVACADAERLPAAEAADRLRHVLVQAQLKDVQVLQVGWRRFDPRRLPALLHCREGWFVASRDAAGHVQLADAAGMTRRADDESLQDALVLWLRPRPRAASAEPLALRGNRAAQLVWRELFREPGWLSKVLIATVLVNLLAVFSSLYAMQVYDRVVPTMAYATLTTLVTGMLLVIALDWFLKTLRARILDSVAIGVDKRVSQQLFDHLLHLRLDVQPKSLGTLAAQVGSLEGVRQFFSAAAIFGLIDLPFALLFVAVVAVIGGKVAWVYVLLLPVALGLGYVAQLRLRELLRHQIVRQHERQGVLVDAIRGAESIRASNAGWRFSQEWQAITASIDGYLIQQKAIHNLTSVTTGSLSNFAYVVAVVVGVWQIEAGLLTMGGLIACSIVGGRVIAPMAQGVQYMTQWQQVVESLRMVNGVLDLDRERRDGQNLLLPERAPDSLGIEKLRFAYAESPVRQVDIPRLEFRAGERVLLLGPVGCGKSTLLKLMAGLYRPSEGRVRLGDADLWEIDPQLVASQVGYLPQTVHLFKGTLRGNLALSGAGGDSRLLKVTRDLGIDAIAADSPLGMDLSISEGGEGLSGGQRQLVALARVVINAPRIWLLDEPTAALDRESEGRVWDVLEENLRPEDILVVATHRPMQAIKLATRVVVMQRGEVVKDGSPQAVLAQAMSGKAQHSGLDAARRAGGRHDVV